MFSLQKTYDTLNMFKERLQRIMAYVEPTVLVQHERTMYDESYIFDVSATIIIKHDFGGFTRDIEFTCVECKLSFDEDGEFTISDVSFNKEYPKDVIVKIKQLIDDTVLIYKL